MMKPNASGLSIASSPEDPPPADPRRLLAGAAAGGSLPQQSVLCSSSPVEEETSERPREESNSSAIEGGTAPVPGNRSPSPVSPSASNHQSAASPSPEAVKALANLGKRTEVQEWLTRHNLIQYGKTFAENGYDDMEDLIVLVSENGPLFADIVPLHGHRDKLRRLLVPTPTKRGSRLGTPARVSAATAGAAEGGESRLPAPTNSVSRSRSPYTMTRSPSLEFLSPTAANRALFDSNNTPTVRRPSGVDFGIDQAVSLKVIVVGAPATGKTSFVRRLVHDEFLGDRQTPTIGVDYFSKKFRVGANGPVVTMQFWDIWGQDKAAQISRSVFTGAKGAIIIYDSCKPDTLAAASMWKQEIDNKIGSTLPGRTVPAILVGNKSDLPKEERIFKDKPSVQQYCNEMRFMEHRFCSAKTGEGVQDATEFLLTAILKSDIKVGLESHSSNGDIVTLDDKMRPQQISRGTNSGNSKRDGNKKPKPGEKKKGFKLPC